ncbi:MAG: SdrD B-like domain-containing protein, partial [Planctomycetota bacterium]
DAANFGGTVLAGRGIRTFYLAKYNTEGKVIWAKAGGGASSVSIDEIALDQEGNIHISGYYGGNEMNFGDITLSGPGFRDVFLAKFDTSGDLIWAKTGGSQDVDRAKGMNIDEAGNVYLIGEFYGDTAIFDGVSIPGHALFPIHNNFSDIFVVKYDSAGNVIWANPVGTNQDDFVTATTVDPGGNFYLLGTLGEYSPSGVLQWAEVAGSINYDRAVDLLLDQNGNALLTGSFSGSTATIGSFTVTGQGDEDIFTAKFDTDGNAVWAKAGGGSFYDRIVSTVLDDEGNLYLAGTFDGTSATFGSTILTGKGSYDVFLVKYDSGGNLVWANSGGGTSSEEIIAIVLNNQGDLHVTGRFWSDSINFDDMTVFGQGETDIFAAKFDSAGALIWLNAGGSNGYDYVSVPILDAEGNTYITGTFDGSMAVFGETILENYGGYDIYVAGYDSSGHLIRIDSGGSNNDDTIVSSGLDEAGNLYVAGTFTGPFATLNNITVDGFGSYDIFLAKYSPHVTVPRINYEAASSNESVAEATAVGNQLLITPKERGSATITITARDSGGRSASQSFDLHVDSSAIYGTKWNDLNSDGVRDEIEPGLEGWTAFLDLNNNRVLDMGEATAITDANGHYSFTNLSSGNYTVTQARFLADAWRQTFPSNLGSHSILLASGNVATELDFGNFRVVDIEAEVDGIRVSGPVQEGTTINFTGNVAGDWQQQVDPIVFEAQDLPLPIPEFLDTDSNPSLVARADGALYVRANGGEGVDELWRIEQGPEGPMKTRIDGPRYPILFFQVGESLYVKDDLEELWAVVGTTATHLHGPRKATL